MAVQRNAALKKARAKQAKIAKKKALQDTAAKARALKKLGLYNPKESIKQSTLTAAKKRRINKLYTDLQKRTHYNAESGRVIRPLIKQDRVAKGGKVYPRYELSQFFHLVKTKKKLKVGQRNAIKSSKGILVEKERANYRIKVSKNGTITEYLPGTRRRIRRTSYSGKELLSFLDDIENDKVKLDADEYLTLDRWGWGTPGALGEAYGNDELQSLADLFKEYVKQMPPTTFSAFIHKSEVTRRRY